jgi:hypothetical protein
VFAGLRHDALVRRDHEQGRVNAAHPRQHILDEIAVAGHVNHAYRLAVREVEPGEAQVNGHLPLALFF